MDDEQPDSPSYDDAAYRDQRLPTIDEVAAAAGVSKTTVSHVLSGRRPVAAATKARVLQVVGAMDFRPSGLATSLKKSRSLTVAVVVQDLTNPFYPALARGVQQSVHEAGYLNLLVDAGNDPATARTFVLDAVDRRVDGMVLAGLDIDAAGLAGVARAGIPVVSVGRALPGTLVDVVSANDVQVAFDAVAHLVARGHVRIAAISGPQSSGPGRDRLRGFTDGMQAAGLRTPQRLLATGDWTREGSHRAMAKLLALATPPTAVFCANDLMAIGALDAARERGIDVPGALAVIGVDDIDAASLVTPALTTVRIPATEIGRRAGHLLLERIATPRRGRDQLTNVHVDHDLIVRSST